MPNSFKKNTLLGCGETVFAETIGSLELFTEGSRSNASRNLPRNKDNETDGDSGSQQID